MMALHNDIQNVWVELLHKIDENETQRGISRTVSPFSILGFSLGSGVNKNHRYRPALWCLTIFSSIRIYT